jgi:hypothetical protein
LAPKAEKEEGKEKKNKGFVETKLTLVRVMHGVVVDVQKLLVVSVLLVQPVKLVGSLAHFFACCRFMYCSTPANQTHDMHLMSGK